MKHISKIIISLILFTTVSLTSAQIIPSCTDMVYNNTFPVSHEIVKVICHKRYVVGFSELRHTPLWVAEVLTSHEVLSENVKRVDNFRPDPNILPSLQSSTKAYIGTGFDKGHLNNFEDVSDDAVAADESFFMTNMIPQYAQNNRGIWHTLENYTRKLAVSKGTVYVITGPIFDGKIVTLSDGTPIPTRIYKIIISPTTKEAYTIVMPNAKGLASSTLPAYLTTVKNLRIINSIIDVLPNDPGFIDKSSFK